MCLLQKIFLNLNDFSKKFVNVSEGPSKRKPVIKITDYLLVQRIKNGDSTAWEILVSKYYDDIYSYCVRNCYGNRTLAADLTQDIFLNVVKNIASYRFTGKFYNYLFTITINTCRNYYTKKRHVTTELTPFLETLSANDDVEDILLHQEQQHFVQEALNQLSDVQREALTLKFYYDFKVKEIAKLTKVSVPTCQSRIQQGLKKLAVLLKEEGNDDANH